MSTTSKQYRFTSDVGKFNAGVLLAAHETGEKVDEDKALEGIAEKSYAKFHVKGGLYADDSTAKKALGRVKRDLERLKGKKWAIPAGGLIHHLQLQLAVGKPRGGRGLRTQAQSATSTAK